MNAPVDVSDILIETNRLVLRPWRDSDLHDFYEYASVEGVGEKATDDDFVKVKYVGKLINDTVFDDSKGEAREFPVKGVVPGFAEGLKLLGKGGKATLYIPGKLGYGVQGQPAAGIGPNQMLVFEVEITEINNESKPKGIPGKPVKK